MDQEKTNNQYGSVIESCKTECFKKNNSYGQSWNRYRAISLLEKICIKLERIQNIQRVGTQKVEDSVASEFPAIINYSILGRIKCRQWEAGREIGEIVSEEELKQSYDEQVACIKEIFMKKNHDYNESWRKRSIGFMVDEMLVKYDRAAHINKATVGNDKKRKEFEEILADICNYAIFCNILISEGADPMI